MKRSKVTVPSRVFTFGCRRPDEDSEEILCDQARRRSRFQARLTEIEIRRRSEREALIRSKCPEYRTAQAEADRIGNEIDALYETLAKERARKRKRVQVEGLTEQIEGLKASRKAAWARAKTAREAFMARLTPSTKALKAARDKAFKGKSLGSAERGKIHAELVKTLAKRPETPREWGRLMAIDARANGETNATRRVAFDPELDGDTKELAREAFKQAAEKTAKNGGRMRLPGCCRDPEPELSDFPAEGRVGRMGLSATVAEDGTVRSREFTLVDSDEPIRHPDSKRSVLRKRMVATLTLRSGRSVTIRVLVHRPLPVGATVKRAWVLLGRRGAKRIWDLQLTVQAPRLDARPPGRRHEAVAVKASWRELPHEPGATPAIVAMTWLGSDGQSGEIILDARTNAALLNVEELRSHQDEHHEEAKRVARLYARFSGDAGLLEATAGSASWRSPRHVAAIAWAERERLERIGLDVEATWRAWKAACAANHADLFQRLRVLRAWCERRGIAPREVFSLYLEWWRRKNRHLREWEQNERATAELRRREGYRVAAADLASKYDQLLICHVDKAKAARKRRPEQEVQGPEERWTGQRRRAAPSTCEVALANAFRTTVKAARVAAKTPEEALGLKAKTREPHTEAAE